MSSREETARESGFRGISLNLFNIAMIVIGVTVAVLMIYATAQTNENYRLMDSVVSEALLSQEATGKMESIASAMSGSALAFANPENRAHDPSHIYAYLGQLTALNPDFSDEGMLSADRQAEDPDLARAVSIFNTLRETEGKAMRLKAESLSMPMSGMPGFLQQAKLTEEEAGLPAEEKAARAFSLLNAPAYLSLRSQLTGAVDASHRFVSEQASARTARASEKLRSVVLRQRILIIAFVIIAMVALIMNRVLILVPINRSVERLDRREPLPVRGSAEMRHLARVYNDVLRDNEEKTETLSYTATHDPLTGVYNRAAFDKAYRLYRGGQIGVDLFKHYNDDFGHDMGDRVLVRVAEVLKHSFREEDHISRIGGDEFCVIVMNTGMEQAERIRETVRNMNAVLASPGENLPPLTISVGAAFWDRPDPAGDIVKDADTALLEIKKRRDTNCGIYGENPPAGGQPA